MSSFCFRFAASWKLLPIVSSGEIIIQNLPTLLKLHIRRRPYIFTWIDQTSFLALVMELHCPHVPAWHSFPLAWLQRGSHYSSSLCSLEKRTSGLPAHYARCLVALQILQQICFGSVCRCMRVPDIVSSSMIPTLFTLPNQDSKLLVRVLCL